MIIEIDTSQPLTLMDAQVLIALLSECEHVLREGDDDE